MNWLNQIVDNTLFGKIDRIYEAVELLKKYEPDEGYYLAFSGGKDSVVIEYLAKLADVKYEAWYHPTTIDPPDLVRFIRTQYPDVKFLPVKKSFLRILEESKGFPMRNRRWCCDVFKKRSPPDRTVILGIRREESSARRKRYISSVQCDTINTFVYPIIKWSTDNVWKFIKEFNLPYCTLYNEGFKRLGCIFCPFSSKREKLMFIARYPALLKRFLRSFEKLYQKAREKGKSHFILSFHNGEELFLWWLEVSKHEVETCLKMNVGDYKKWLLRSMYRYTEQDFSLDEENIR